MNRRENLEQLIQQIYTLHNKSIEMQAVALGDIDAPEIDEELQDIAYFASLAERLALTILNED
jgi:hypothetical protein